jgi:hypothetical protein
MGTVVFLVVAVVVVFGHRGWRRVFLFADGFGQAVCTATRLRP